MNFKFRITKYLAVSALAVLLLGACSKNNIYMDVAYPNGEENSGGEEGNNDNPDKKDALITFSASVEGRNITRAMSPMGKGLQSWLCAYPSNTTNTILSNGVDYLWWHALHQDVTSSQVNIPITYQHVATQVVITITGGENITLNKVLSATITPTKPGAFMDLSTGIISSEVSYDKPADMGINDFTVQYIMLPLKSSDPMALTMELMVNGESFSRTYNTTIIPPDNILAAGNSYLFRAVINENSVSFGNVSVKDWTDVDESGNPLYPIQD